MSFRVTIRMCLDKDKGSLIRNKVAKVLKANGLKLQGMRTATWEGDPVSSTAVAKIMTELSQLSDIATSYPAKGKSGKPAKPSSAKLDHLWVYVTKSRTTGA